MNSALISFSLLATLAVAPPPPPPSAGDNGVRPGVGPGIRRTDKLPPALQPPVNGVRPALGPAACRPQTPPPAARTTPPRSADVPRAQPDVRTHPRY